MILVLDNYDSFTHNLVQRIGELGRGEQVQVVRNDRMSPEAAEAELHPNHLIISPGPCTPNEAGLSCEYVRYFHGKLPILGVCLDHQCIGHAFGGGGLSRRALMHGKTTEIRHDGRGVFAGLANPFIATRYHSLSLGTLPYFGPFGGSFANRK